MFHLFTHAFFKALLFLGSGSVIHGLHHEQDMRFMGGVRKPMMFTWAMMLVGTLALTGVGIPGTQIGFAGFFSKDAIIEGSFLASENGRTFAQIAFWCGVTAAFLTSFYSWRLMFMAFEGKFRPNPEAHHDDHAHGGAHDAHGHDDHHHAKPADGAAPAHESPAVMTAPLAILAAGAIFAGGIFAPYFLKDEGNFWRGAIVRTHDPLHPAPAAAEGHAPAAAHGGATGHAVADGHTAPAAHSAAAPAAHAAEGEHGEGGHHIPSWVLWAPFAVTLAGFLLALPIYFFSQTMGAAIARTFAPINAFLSKKWYFDELYDAVLVKGARALGDLFWKGGDKRIIDGLGPDGFAWMSKFTARQMRRIQTGYVYHYSFFMLIAVAAIGAWAIWSGGALP
jgi:NADH-quinone oxidoreductase subunit L